MISDLNCGGFKLIILPILDIVNKHYLNMCRNALTFSVIKALAAYALHGRLNTPDSWTVKATSSFSYN